MARTVQEIDAEIALFNSFKDEFSKPLFDTNITNRFEEFTKDGIIYNKVTGKSEFDNVDDFLALNTNQMLILELGEDINGNDIIRNSYEIGSEAIVNTIASDVSIDFNIYGFSLYNNEGFASAKYNNNYHYAPYLPDNSIKFARLLNVYNNGIDYEFNLFSDEDAQTISSIKVDNSGILNSHSLLSDLDIRTLTISDLPDFSLTNDYYSEELGVNTNLRKSLYDFYMDSVSWYIDENGEVEDWYIKTHGDIDGKYKVISSWQIYEWIIGEIDELERERTFLLSRTQEEIDEGFNLSEFIDSAGLRSTYDNMFREYPGVFTSVKIQLGFYKYEGDEGLDKGNGFFESYGYARYKDIKSSFIDSGMAPAADAERLESYFAIDSSYPVTGTDELGNPISGFVNIYRLKYDDFFNATFRDRYFLVAFSLGLNTSWDEPCRWDKVIIFIILVIITWASLGTATAASASALYAFGVYLSLIVMWAQFFGIGGKNLKYLGYLASLITIYSSFQTGMASAAAAESTKELTKDVAKEMAERAVIQSTVIKGVIASISILVSETMSIDATNEKDILDMEDYDDYKKSSTHRKNKQKHEEELQFFPLERLMAKNAIKQDKQNRMQMYDNKLKEMYGR